MQFYWLTRSVFTSKN